MNTKVKYFLESILVTSSVVITFNYSTTRLAPIIIGLMYFLLQYNRREEVGDNKRERRIIILFSFFFVIALTLTNFENFLRYEGSVQKLLVIIVAVSGLLLCAKLILSLVVNVLAREEKSIINDSFCKRKKRYFWVPLGIIIGSWLIGYGISFPGDLSIDSINWLEMALGYQEMAVTFPIPITILMRGMWNLGAYVTQSANGGVAHIMLFQILALSLSVSYLVYKMFYYGINKAICILMVAIYAFAPYHVHFSHTLWKDIPSAICTLWFITLLWEYYVGENYKGIVHILRLGAIAFFGIGMAVCRANGYYALLFSIPFVLYLFWKRNKRIFITVSLMIVLLFIIRGPVFDHIINTNHVELSTNEIPLCNCLVQKQESENETTNVEDNEITKVNGASDYYAGAVAFDPVMLQMLARVAVDIEELSEEDYTLLSQVFEVEKVKEEYTKHVSDNTLRLKKSIDRTEYYRIFFHFLKKYPTKYILAWKDQTYGYYYPDVAYWVIADDVQDNQIGIYRDPKMPTWIEDLSEELNDARRTLPIYGVIWSIGYVVWFIVLSMLVCTIKNGWQALLLFTPLVGTWLTMLLASPVYAEFRYVYAFFLCVPLYLLIPIVKKE